MTEKLEELQLPQEAVESESRGAIYSIPITEDGGGGSSTPEDPAEAPRTPLGNCKPFYLGFSLLREVGGRRVSPSGYWDHDWHNSALGISPITLQNLVFK